MITVWCQLKVRARVETLIKIFPQCFFSVLLGLIDFSDIVMLGSGPNSCCQQNLECFDIPLLSLGLFSWKSSNNCYTNLNMFFKPQPDLDPQCPICAGMLLSIACKETQESGWKQQKITKNYADKVIIRFFLLPTVALRPPLASLSIQVSILFGTYDNPFCLCLLLFAE